MNMTLTPEQVEQARSGHFVVPGDRPLDLQGDAMPTVHQRFVAPQRWVDATGPCETCGGVHEWMQNWPGPNDLGRIKKTCPDCIGGKVVHEFRVTCPKWEWVDGKQRNCRRCNGVGTVLAFRATIDLLLPVWNFDHDDTDPLPNHACRFDDGRVAIVRDGTFVSQLIALNPLPSPGRDWMAVLGNVEWPT